MGVSPIWLFPFIVCVIFLEKTYDYGRFWVFNCDALCDRHCKSPSWRAHPTQQISWFNAPWPSFNHDIKAPKSHLPQNQPTCHPWPYHNRSRWKWCIFHQYFCCFSTQVGDTKTTLQDMWGSWTGTPKSWGGVEKSLWNRPLFFLFVSWMILVLGWSKSSEREAFGEKNGKIN